MSTTANKLNYLENTKLAIKQALTDKGVTVSDSDTFRSYADKIDEIEGGSGESPIFTSIEKLDSTVDFSVLLVRCASKIDTTNVTGITLKRTIWDDDSNSFASCKAESLILKNFDTSECTNLSNLFQNCSNLKELDISSWDTSKVTGMRDMFSNCSSLTSVNLSYFDFSNIGSNILNDFNSLEGMFFYCLSLTSVIWPEEVFINKNGKTVGSMSLMFYGCSSLTSIDLSSFNTSNVTNMGQMFSACSKLTNVTWGNNWASNSAITSFDVSSCPLSHDSCLDLFNKLATKSSNATLQLSTTTKGYMSEEEIAIATNKGWTVS